MSDDPTSYLIRILLHEDHDRRCEGLRYVCSCGYDIRVYDAAEAALVAAMPQTRPMLVRVATLAWEHSKLRRASITASDIAAIILEAKKG